MNEHKELEFFNDLSIILRIELTEPTVEVSPCLMNEKATPSAKIKSITASPEVWEEEADNPRNLTEEELQSTAFCEPEIKLTNLGRVITHKAPNGKFFTVAQLMEAVLETERQTRGEMKWAGGIDVHHVFFEGIGPGKNNEWLIYWGS